MRHGLARRNVHELLGELDEIVGSGEEIVGYGVNAFDTGYPEEMEGEEILGAGVMLPGGRQVMTRPLTKSRDQLLPLSSTTNVLASATALVSAQPQVIFRPERWVIQDPTPNFTVNDLKVGKDSQFLNAGGVPSSVFSPTAVGVRLKLDTATVSMFITASVTNNDGGAAHAFISALIGPAVG